MGIKYFKRAILNKKREEKTWTSRRHLHPKDYFTNDVFRPIFYSPVYHLFHFRFRIQIYQSRKSFRLFKYAYVGPILLPYISFQSFYTTKVTFKIHCKHIIGQCLWLNWYSGRFQSQRSTV